jgi:hypothetical protein
MFALNTAIWVAAIGGTATVLGAFVPIFMLIARYFMDKALSQNSAEHGETKLILGRIEAKVGQVDEKVDSHIAWHAHAPAPTPHLAPVIYLTPPAPVEEVAPHA